MDQLPLAYPRPAALDERIKLRGCRNCIAWDNGRCRANPQSVTTGPEEWCTNWRWNVNPRVGWESAFAGREKEQTP